MKKILTFLISFIRGCLVYERKYKALLQELHREKRENYLDACALAILSEEVIGISKNGHIPEHFASRRLAVKWAVDRVQYRHAWVVCGAGPGMEGFLKEMDKEPFKPLK